MKISVLIPTYHRPAMLAEALASIGEQDRSLIAEVLVGDNSTAAARDANRAVIAASAIADLVHYHPNEPALGHRENQWALAERARSAHILFLHDDDKLCAGGLKALVTACAEESDPSVKVWFGGNYIMDEAGAIDLERTRANDRLYGKEGAGGVRPVWRWCLTQSLPPNSSLLDRAAYLSLMHGGAREGNVADWGFWVRLANSGAHGRYVPQYVWAYRVQTASLSTSGAAMDAHLWYEIGSQLRVPPEAEIAKRDVLRGVAQVATLRYLRDGERRNALHCMTSKHWTWRRRLSARGFATIAMMMTPRPFWFWALRHRA